MEKLGYCEIHGMRLSVKSKEAVASVRDIMKKGQLFSTAVSAILLFQIFASSSITNTAVESAISIREYHWEIFAKTLRATSPIVRGQIFKVAY
ncbi:hypothetical protein HC752_23035 [Vibrio sp. S9_S30]|uniref:hypothetical protein n=1 Tax=Vibrio sp. S9_S30 TaxID=2720226 RepID=UPI00168022DB|nr:hypothetical protein [Vibrio sp. S9_S30]MBD1559811.1 hypothetical protein [Vibrio sp. S9_S30]